MFWQFEQKSGMTFSQSERKLHHLVQRFIGRGMVDEAVDALLTEKLIEIMSPTAATYVR